MDAITLVVAAVAAFGVLLIFVSLAGGSDVNARLERYASSEPTDRPDQPQQALRERIAPSPALTSFNRVVEKRDWATNMARELARADLALKPSEFLAIRLAVLFGIPGVMILL